MQPLEAAIAETYSLLADTLGAIFPATHPYAGFLGAILEASCNQKGSPLTSTVVLPLSACLAAGGSASAAVPVAASWYALQLAARVLDDVQDGDSEAWAHLGGTPALLTNAGTGLLALASLILSTHLPSSLHDTILVDTQQVVLHMAGGQHRDLSANTTTLETYWDIATNKSAIFFALATRNGARCALASPDRIALLDQVGWDIGLAIQLADDLVGFHDGGDLSQGIVTLPILFALEQSAPTEREQVWEWVRRAPHDAAAEAALRGYVSGQGAPLYLWAEAVRYRERACYALEGLLPQAEPLLTFVRTLIAVQLPEPPNF